MYHVYAFAAKWILDRDSLFVITSDSVPCPTGPEERVSDARDGRRPRELRPGALTKATELLWRVAWARRSDRSWGGRDWSWWLVG